MIPSIAVRGPVPGSAPLRHGRQARSGTILLICMSLIAAMVAISFAYVLSMRTAAETGPSTIALSLARQSAKAGTAHACEVLMRDYLDRPTVPTSDASPHRVFFDAIDNQSPAAPREVKASLASAANLWNDNDVNPHAKNLNPYRTFNAHEGRVYDNDPDTSWLTNFVSSSTPRYIEPMHFSLSNAIEASPGKTDFTAVPSASPGVNTPIYYDSRWQPVPSRDLARYRLRYAVWCEDLSGHIFTGIPAPYTRGDPLAVDGDLIASGRNNQGTEMDRAWAKRYAPSMSAMFLGFATSDSRGLLLDGGGVQAYGIAWLGTDTIDGERHQTNGFTTSGVMLGSSPWIWRTGGSYATGGSWGTPWHPITSPVSYRFTGKRYTPQALNEITNGAGLTLGGLLTPYGAPTRWDRNPDPETADVEELAFNEGATDSPWRVNLLTAPSNTLRAMFTGYRPSYLWEHRLTWKVVFTWKGWDGSTPTWNIPSPIPANYPHIHKVVPAKISNLGVPDPFRAGFLTKDRATGAVNRRPFAQFQPSPSAINPRAQLDPAYPSPVMPAHSECIGRFYDLERDGRWFTRGDGQMGPCTPRLDNSRRMPLQYTVTTFNNTYTPGGMPSDTSAYRVPEEDMEVYYGFDPWTSRIPVDLDGDGVPEGENGKDWRYAGSARPQLAITNAFWLDALAAAYSSAAVAIAAHQADVPYPAEPAGGVAMFAGKWGSGPTLDRDADGDGHKESNSVFANVADLDRLFLLILGEDPSAPGSNTLTRSAVVASMPGGNGSYTPTIAPASTSAYSTAPFVPRIVGLPAYAPGAKDYSTDFDTGWAQNPFVHHDASQFINLRRTSLLGLRRGIYTNGETGLHADNAARHLADTEAMKSEAAALTKSGGTYAADAKTRAKHLQLMRCRLRDAERIINDMRMSFFGANLRYRDSTRLGHPSRGRFRPYDLDGDGWAICSAYCPSDLVSVALKDTKNGKVAYRFSEPSDWSTVVFDKFPDNPNRIDDTHVLNDTTGPVWVCFKDVDVDGDPANLIELSNNTDTSDFKDLLTYSPDDDADVGTFPGSRFGPMSTPASRAGYTRWFYPAVRVVQANDTDVTDGVAAYPPDTYFSLTGYFTLEKSRFYRMITRGEVWDEWRRLILNSALLETVFMLDPDGDVLVKTPSKPVPIHPVTGRASDASGLQDSSIIYQRWLRDYSPLSRNRMQGSP